MRVLGFGTYDARLHPRVHTLLDGLEERGALVRELNRPLGLSTQEKVQLLQQPWRLPVLAVKLIAKWIALAAESLRLRGRNHPDVVVVGYMGHFDVLLARALFPRAVVVLDHLVFAAGTARDRGTDEGLRTRLLGLLDRAALRAADVIVLDTDEHAAMLPASAASKGVVVPVGAPRAWVEARREVSSRGPLRVIFYGLFTPLQGATVVAEGIRIALESGAPIEATLVGDGQDAPPARVALGEAEVEWLSWVDPERIAHLVASHDVCLGVFGTTDKARNVVPNKVFQGAAAGCALITSDTPPQRRLFEGAAVLVPPGDADALAAELIELATDRSRLDQLRTAAAARYDTCFEPASVVESLERRLQQMTMRA